EKTAEKEGSFKQQNFKFKSEVIGNNMKYGKERQVVSEGLNIIIRAESSKPKEKNKVKEYTEELKASLVQAIILRSSRKKTSTVFLTGAKVVQTKMDTTRRLNIPSSTSQKLDGR
ncbi:22072_t:CDS:2, partial [Gigaspora rosea]